MISNSQADKVDKSKSAKKVSSSIVNGTTVKDVHNNKSGEQKRFSLINKNNNNNKNKTTSGGGGVVGAGDSDNNNNNNNNRKIQSKIPVYNRNQSGITVDNFIGWQNQLKLIQKNHNIGELKIMDLPEHVRIHQNIHNRLNHSCHHNRAQELPRSLPSTPGSLATKMTDESGSSTVLSSSSNNNNNRKQQSRKKRNTYEEYLPLCEMQKGLQKGEIVEGILRVNQRNYNDAYISAPDGGLDIFISGLIDRNKALNGDSVAVQLFEEDKWMISYTAINSNWNEWKEDFQQFTLTNIDIDFEQLNLNSKDSNLINLRSHSSNNCQASIAELLQNEFPNLPIGLFAIGVRQLKQKIPYWPKFIQRMGKVVRIIEQNHPRVFAGTIKFTEDMVKKNVKKSYLMFTCCDQRNPQIVLPIDCIPEKVLNDCEHYRNHLFLAEITEWKSDSLYPCGRIIKSFGKCGNIETETEAMLITFDIKKEDFPEEALQEYRRFFPGENWSIPAKEYAERKDLRQQCIFTIDPETAKDLDDAISYRELSNGQIEIGVHIADVSYFINENSLLDQIAKQRATSVYLVSQVIPMLPHIFCQDLCSLNPGEDKLTFSVIFKFDQQGNVLDKWFGRTVINSCCKLAYEHAQDMIESKNSIDGDDDQLDASKFPKIFGKWSLSDICGSVQALHRITQILKVRRYENGSLRLDKKKLCFMLNEEGLPIALANYPTKDSNHLIEELMLLANKSVAELLYDSFAEQGRAFLRGHPPLSTQNLNEFFKYIKDVANIDFNAESSATVKESLELLKQTTTDNVFRMATLVLIKSMLLAFYVAVNEKDDPIKYHHYALNFSKYTHFTSPIRRYADVIVHRLLSTALGYPTVCSQSSSELRKIAQNCNTKKYNAYCASERSAKIYLKAYISKLGRCICKAMVYQVLDRAFDVLVLDFDIIERIYLDQLMLDDFEFVKTLNGTQLKLNWTKMEGYDDGSELQQTIKNFDELDIEITVTDKFEFKILMAHPNGQFIQKANDS